MWRDRSGYEYRHVLPSNLRALFTTVLLRFRDVHWFSVFAARHPLPVAGKCPLNVDYSFRITFIDTFNFSQILCTELLNAHGPGKVTSPKYATGLWISSPIFKSSTLKTQTRAVSVPLWPSMGKVSRGHLIVASFVHCTHPVSTRPADQHIKVTYILIPFCTFCSTKSSHSYSPPFDIWKDSKQEIQMFM